MLSKSQRLPVKEFRSCQPRQSAATRFFIIKFSKNRLSYNRLGVIISSKVISGAVKRHAIKRKVVQVFKNWPKTGLDVLFVATRYLKELPLEKLEAELIKILKQINNK